MIKIPRLSPLKQIRGYCLYCSVGQLSKIHYCSDPGCPHWTVRFGKSPKRVIKEESSQAKQLFLGFMSRFSTNWPKSVAIHLPLCEITGIKSHLLNVEDNG